MVNNENAREFMHLPCQTFASPFAPRSNGLVARVFTHRQTDRWKDCSADAGGNTVNQLITAVKFRILAIFE